jgi:hypothetical protein
MYREDFCLVDRFHGSVTYGDRYTASCEARAARGHLACMGRRECLQDLAGKPEGKRPL